MDRLCVLARHRWLRLGLTVAPQPPIGRCAAQLPRFSAASQPQEAGAASCGATKTAPPTCGACEDGVDIVLAQLGADIEVVGIPPDLYAGLQVRRHRVALLVRVPRDVHHALRPRRRRPGVVVQPAVDCDRLGRREPPGDVLRWVRVEHAPIAHAERCSSQGESHLRCRARPACPGALRACKRQA